MSQLICQSNLVDVTRSCTHKARIQETELKLNSKIEVKKAHKTNKKPLTDTAAKENGVGKTHSNFLIGDVLQK